MDLFTMGKMSLNKSFPFLFKISSPVDQLADRNAFGKEIIAVINSGFGGYAG